MFFSLQKMIEDGAMEPDLALLKPLPGVPHLGKNAKGSLNKRLS